LKKLLNIKIYSKMNSSTDYLATNTIRLLAADMVEKANSGHPGAPIGMAPVAHVLFSKFLQVTKRNPKWLNRDRFVLSNGHACALQYTMLYLLGYISMDDLKQFRQTGSICPGHPENFMTAGIEVCTGPLGQGIANAVGMAMAHKNLAARYNTDRFKLIDHMVWVFCGDGCLQEGVSGEASSLAGHLGLSNLCVVYDDNSITIDGHTGLSFTENVKMRYEAYGWQVIEVSRGDTELDTIQAALCLAKNSTTGKPIMIKLKTVIGYNTNKENTHGVHGAPLGTDSLKLFRSTLQKEVGSQYFNAPFEVPSEVNQIYQNVQSKNSQAYDAWMKMWQDYQSAEPEKASQLSHMMNGTLPSGWDDGVLKLAAANSAPDATRKTSAKVINELAHALPHLVGGSADLTPSNKTDWKGKVDFQKDTPHGRYFRFGVREHGMFSICNGLATYGLIPFSATFLNFITYGWGAARLAALGQHGQIFVMTHDSVWLGEDGPTHQPIETIALMRATPNMEVWRPADMTETCAAYKAAVERRDGPSIMCLTRQKTGELPRKATIEEAMSGGYKVMTASNPQVIIIATGSEVGFSVEAAKELSDKGVRVEVISAPCLERFANTELGKGLKTCGVPVVSVEAACTMGWSRFATYHIGIDRWGKSGPFKSLQKYFGFTPSAIASRIQKEVLMSD